MKKFFCYFVIFFITTIVVSAQNDSTKIFQEIQGGMIVGVSASTKFLDSEIPFNMGYGLLANVTIVTPKTYHNFMYGFGDNSFSFLSGYLIPKNWDIYAVYSKVLNANQNYLGLGIEKKIKAGGVSSFIFSELGTDFKGAKILTFGVLISSQNKFWKRR